MREFGVAVALALVGYGLTIVLGLVAHESPFVGWLSVVLGAVLLASFAANRQAPSASASASASASPASESASTPASAPASASAKVQPAYQWAIFVLATVLCLGTVAYNVVRRSGLTVPELALVVYGVLLLASLPWLGRSLGRGVTVMTAVAWSVPVVLAPLAIYAANGILTSQAGSEAAAASPLVRWALVLPTAGLLDLLGHDVAVRGNALLLATPRGSLTLSVGLVCAGIYPAILFASLFALYAWDRKPPWKQALLQGASGLAALWALNLLRMVVLAKVGVAKGTAALQQVHDQIGWLLFAVFSVVYWWLVLRKPARRGDAPSPAV